MNLPINKAVIAVIGIVTAAIILGTMGSSIVRFTENFSQSILSY